MTNTKTLDEKIDFQLTMIGAEITLLNALKAAIQDKFLPAVVEAAAAPDRRHQQFMRSLREQNAVIEAYLASGRTGGLSLSHIEYETMSPAEIDAESKRILALRRASNHATGLVTALDKNLDFIRRQLEKAEQETPEERVVSLKYYRRQLTRILTHNDWHTIKWHVNGCAEWMETYYGCAHKDDLRPLINRSCGYPLDNPWQTNTFTKVFDLVGTAALVKGMTPEPVAGPNVVSFAMSEEAKARLALLESLTTTGTAH
jgi:hypothetical protein